MSTFSYVIVLTSGDTLPGTDDTGNFSSPEQLGQWWRDRMPDAVEVQVWAGEFADRPVLVGAVA